MTCRGCNAESETDVCPDCLAKIRAKQQAVPYDERFGEKVARLTSKLGIPECGGCGKRRAAMNTVDPNQPASRVLMGLLEAAFSPDEVLDANRKKDD